MLGRTNAVSQTGEPFDPTPILVWSNPNPNASTGVDSVVDVPISFNYIGAYLFAKYSYDGTNDINALYMTASFCLKGKTKLYVGVHSDSQNCYARSGKNFVCSNNNIRINVAQVYRNGVPLYLYAIPAPSES